MNFWNIGKGVLLLFWLAALTNLILPFGSPWWFSLNAVAAVLLVLHLLELVLFHRYLQTQRRPALQRLQVLLFGVLHLQRLD